MASVSELKNVYMSNLLFFIKTSYKLFMQNNMFSQAFNGLVVTFNNILTANRRLQIAKYRVSKVRYRVYQMEQIIQTNNPYNGAQGKKINHIR